jgi:hypothetical protein
MSVLTNCFYEYAITSGRFLPEPSRGVSETLVKMNTRTEIKLNSIQNQLELLELLHRRHSAWGRENVDLEILQAHHEIIDLLEQTMNKYVTLLKLYRRDAQ